MCLNLFGSKKTENKEKKEKKIENCKKKEEKYKNKKRKEEADDADNGDWFRVLWGTIGCSWFLVFRILFAMDVK